MVPGARKFTISDLIKEVKRAMALESDQVTEQTVKQDSERESYEPPMLVEIGQFGALTAGGNPPFQDGSDYFQV
jgi:hypothetical protein